MENLQLPDKSNRENNASRIHTFFKQHKKEILVGTTITMGLVALLAISNSSVPSNAVPSITKTLEKGIPNNLPISKTVKVVGHIRNLPEGMSPSLFKIESAEKFGYVLENHQTWVKTHPRVIV